MPEDLMDLRMEVASALSLLQNDQNQILQGLADLRNGLDEFVSVNESSAECGGLAKLAAEVQAGTQRLHASILDLHAKVKAKEVAPEPVSEVPSETSAVDSKAEATAAVDVVNPESTPANAVAPSVESPPSQ